MYRIVVMPKSELLEEKWNVYSHALGIVLGVLGLIFLLSETSNATRPEPFFIYGFSIILLFSASTVYHAVSDPKLKHKLRILDHISIYYLIAGTYTPVCVYLLKESRGELLLYLVWGLAIFGTILKLFFTGKFEIFSLVLYGIMGWAVVIDVNYLISNISSNGLFFLGLGGVFYTVGMLFYALKKIPYNHLIWHFFVLGGALCHWWFVYSEFVL
ncbi:MAG: hemolysin III family protein [Bacteroidota bacterium]